MWNLGIICLSMLTVTLLAKFVPTPAVVGQEHNIKSVGPSILAKPNGARVLPLSPPQDCPRTRVGRLREAPQDDGYTNKSNNG